MGWRTKCSRFKITYIVGLIFSFINAVGVLVEVLKSVDILFGGLFLFSTIVLIGLYFLLTYFIFKHLLPAYTYCKRNSLDVTSSSRDKERL